MEKHKKVIQKKKKNENKVSAPTWNDKFELPDGSYSVSLYYKKHEPVTDNPPIRIYVNKMENGIPFKIKTRYHLELLMVETVKYLGSTRSKKTKLLYIPHKNVIYLKTFNSGFLYIEVWFTFLLMLDNLLQMYAKLLQ